MCQIFLKIPERRARTCPVFNVELTDVARQQDSNRCRPTEEEFGAELLETFPVG